METEPNDNKVESLLLSMALGDYIGKISEDSQRPFDDTFLMCTFLGIYLMETAKDTVQKETWLQTWIDAKKVLLNNAQGKNDRI